MTVAYKINCHLTTELAKQTNW